jgi:hypothetical protein
VGHPVDAVGGEIAGGEFFDGAAIRSRLD